MSSGINILTIIEAKHFGSTFTFFCNALSNTKKKSKEHLQNIRKQFRKNNEPLTEVYNEDILKVKRSKFPT